MRRIDTPTAAQDLFGPGKHGFRNGDPANAILATRLQAEWFNALQEELAGIVEQAGIALDPDDNTQLLQAVRLFASAGGVTSLSADTVLTAAQRGMVLIDANAGNRVITLPASDADLGVVDVIVRRVDNSGNRLKVQAAGADRIKFHTHLSATGYPFLVLMGAGDWWHLRSDGAGNWWPIGRHDSDAIGRPVFETTTAVAPGGWGVFAGSVFNRADWPWLWDHAQASGMLTTEAARVGMEGGWTSGDGAATFRGPDGRAEFLRVLDNGRGIDAARGAGSNQDFALQGHWHDVSYPNTGGGSEIATALQTIAGASNRNRATTIISDGVNGTPKISGETRPRNIAYPGRIKLI